MKVLRWLLFPFTILYWVITSTRNYLYDTGILKSTFYNLPVICVGNLSVGGTGKSPMIEYLILLLKEDFKIAVLSRGYKRKTSGYIEVDVNHSVLQVGDEPLQIKQNFPDVTVSVCANRREGIEKLKEKAGIILLDDAFQHRKVKASTNIVLTSFNDLYTNDFHLPTGNLRESKNGIKRASIIVVTKCPEKLSYAKMQEIEYRLQLKPEQKLYFSKISYDKEIFGVSETLPLEYLKDKDFTLVTGIANPTPLVEFLKDKEFSFKHEHFPDHHNFSDKEIERLKKNEIIITTEKDFMRLKEPLRKYALYYLPIKTMILRNQEKVFKETILEEIKNYKSNSL
ncbi:tetraacyldisaccharide 4'-kinase [Patiriisocius hiemis]|uniref:Tetraacyldisaccharide 4'-kinase n=1 Tax=Patiriisocius hiemis TaxID=3075604 RepID=A0ABU2YCP8_9FLAO|nr:tetraacyldisaccharide 4'-kinase [Constantimarinum sp. W242]MDT0555950.1 tetraacyldisaccharide 4'-kinase [Constantimarinum sp. W242]